MTSLFSTVYDPKLSANELNHDIQLISQWAFKWKMSFNPDPTKPAEEIICSRKLNQQVHPPLFFNNIMVKQVNEHKHLGLTLDPKLTFTNHIVENIAKARKCVGVIKYLSFYVPIKLLNKFTKCMSGLILTFVMLSTINLKLKVYLLLVLVAHTG